MNYAQLSDEDRTFHAGAPGCQDRDMSIAIRGFDHVGIRVSNAARAVAFYQRLGFRIDRDWSGEAVAELVAKDGTRINLIFNGEARADGTNILLDEPVKWPGFTHAAFIVDKLRDVVEWAAGEGTRITEGPVDWGRRMTCFLRDPDGNVLEFNELI